MAVITIYSFSSRTIRANRALQSCSLASNTNMALGPTSMSGYEENSSKITLLFVPAQCHSSQQVRTASCSALLGKPSLHLLVVGQETHQSPCARHGHSQSSKATFPQALTASAHHSILPVVMMTVFLDLDPDGSFTCVAVIGRARQLASEIDPKVLHVLLNHVAQNTFNRQRLHAAGCRSGTC